MELSVDLSISIIFTTICGFIAAIARHFYKHWSETGRYDRFRDLVVEKVMDEIYHRWTVLNLGSDSSQLVQLSDVVVSSLIDAGFNSKEIPLIIKQACQDTRGQFAGLIKALHTKAAASSSSDQSTQFASQIDSFFEPNVRLDLAHQATTSLTI